ncbi:DNA repair protein RecO [Elizabethkingia sp. JS20170427COW]|uniref:DNA repair protein RecO n=1 Tax=Elizabethkingia sp. JS20170427COW TaxID=2583851 RepID=UPI0011102934|nr:recombination protein O N-terminal domain-containing protein [Elizabethkingia sp. JS20170427COW]QCX52854.1 DNA recombination protein RecO [Elizabethkingia sp. JS20170427COW]
MIQDRGFLLSYIRYGDHDAILHLFSKTQGYQSLFLKGLYSPKNKKKALLQPLVELVYNENKRNSGLPTISTLQLGRKGVEWDIKNNAVVFFMAEFLNFILKKESNLLETYPEIESFLDQLQQGNYASHIQFLVKFTETLGIKPLLEKEELLNPEKGISEKIQTHHLFDIRTTRLWGNILEKGYGVALNNEERRIMMDSLMVYYDLHIPEFKIPQSLEVLQQLWT